MHKMTPADNSQCLARAEVERILKRVSAPVSRLLKQLAIEEDLTSQMASTYIPLAAKLHSLAKTSNRTVIVGINGAQGSGKSTLAALLKMILQEGFGLNVAGFSIDDIYLTRRERDVLGQEVHPLLKTRGVPGTHDVSLGEELLKKLSSKQPGLEIAVPIFDKAVDDRLPLEAWHHVTTPNDILLFEGWCVGTAPQDNKELANPVNRLESSEDPDGRWRSYINSRLATDYAELFSKLDLLIMLRIPEMECVFEWRGLQERKLAETNSEGNKAHIMNEQALERFIMHYERLTRHNLKEMPSRADILLNIDREHQIEDMQCKLLPGRTP